MKASLFHRFSRAALLAALIAIALATSSHRAIAADGEIDPTFVTDFRRASSTSTIFPLLTLLDGKLLVAGTMFTNAGGATPLRNLRLHVDGATDPTFSISVLSGASPSGAICGLVQPDGKILIGGGFTSVNGVARSGVARLHADASLDTSFVPATIEPSPSVGRMALQPDGKVIVLGFFTSVNGQPRTRIARLHVDGSLDAGFNPVFVRAAGTPNLNTVAVRSDGKILVGGVFTSVNGDPRANFVRLNSDGSTDSLTADTDNAVSSLMLEADGSFTMAGSFSTVRGLPYARLVRVNADGSLDATFNPVALPNINSISTIARQVDGKTLVGGSGFTGTTGPLARLNADGSLDSSFTVPDELRHIPGGVSAQQFAQQPDGRIVVARQIAAAATADDNPFPLIRLLNGPGTQSIEIEAARVRWLRAGPLPEVSETRFELSTDNGATWSLLGAGSRITGGWEWTGLSLPARGIVRVLSRPVAGSSTSNVGILKVERPFHFVGSEIAVEQPAERPVPNGGSRDFGRTSVGVASSLAFTVRNFGDATLTGLGTTITGANPTQFALISSPVAPVSGPTGSTGFTVRFLPTSPGVKTATLSIANNTPGSNPFQITLTGTGAADGEVNPAFNPGPYASSPQAFDGVYGTLEQPDGRTVVFGQFSNAGFRARANIFRQSAAGVVEKEFDPNVGGRVRAAVLQGDGKIVIGGAFGSVGGQARSNIARLHADGTLDTSFIASVDGEVYSLALQPDGRVFAAGFFTNANSTPRGRIARFHGDGTLDTSFTDPASGASFIWGLRLQRDGRLLVMGAFNTIGGASHPNLARLNSDGTLDATFIATSGGSANGALIQPDGKIVLFGFHVTVNGTSTPYLTRLNSDGSIDNGFNAGVNNFVYGVALQADGKLLVAGAFTGAGGLSRVRVVRLNSDGSGDPTFTADTSLSTGDSAVFGIGLTADGQVNIGGYFDTVNGVNRSFYARLHNTLAAPSLSVPTADTIEWLRGGTAPQAQWTQFEFSTNGGASWSPLGFGTPISGGWRISGVSLPAAGIVRARALVPSGFHAGSSGFVEQTRSFSFNPLQVWRALHGLAADGSQDLGNPSGDGIANVLKFAFNTAPNVGDLAMPNVTVLPENGTAGLPFITRDAQGRLFIEFVRRKAATNPGISYLVETGDDLQNLQPLDLSGASVTSIDSTWERITVTDPTITPNRFGRVRVQIAP